MESAGKTADRIRTGVFELDLNSGELFKSGRKIALQEQPFRVLRILLEHPGELVPRQDLQNRLWPDDTYVGFDEGLNTAIRKLRTAFGDSADNPRFIETVPRRGYRFIAPIAAVNGASKDQAPQQLTTVPRAVLESQSEPIGSPRGSSQNSPWPVRSPSRSWGWPIIAVCLLAFAAVLWLWIRPRWLPASGHGALSNNATAGSLAKPVLVPLTEIGGEQRMPALSPDGSRIAFLLQTTEPKKSGIYAVVTGSQSLLQLTSNGNDSDPTWAPDGRFIAFLRNSDNKFSIWLVPTFGGPGRQVYTGLRCPWEAPVAISFSPDGQHLAFSEWNPETQQCSIKLVSLSDSSVRLLTSPPQGYHDTAPSFSPKGMWLAFVRWTGPIFVDDVFVVPVAGGAPKQVTFDHRRIFSGIAWTPEEKEIVFSSARAGMKSLWRIPASGGEPEPIAGSGPNVDHPSVSSTGQLAYERDIEDENLWRIDLQNETRAAGPAKPLLSAKTSNLMPDFSPDGHKIAFESDRSGYEEIWTCDADGSNPVQLTRLERYSGSPRWSPDGRWIAFDYRSQQHSEIYVVDVATGSTQRVARFADADSVVPSWSRDGRWIYFASNHGGKAVRIWKASLSVDPPVQVTKHNGIGVSESDDGNILFTRFSEPGIMKVDPAGTESLFWRGRGPDNWANWALSANGIYLIDSEPAGATIKFLDFKTQRVTSVAKLEKPSFYGLRVAPDRKSLVYAQRDRIEHDIVLMKDF